MRQPCNNGIGSDVLMNQNIHVPKSGKLAGRSFKQQFRHNRFVGSPFANALHRHNR
jgi:hypothetical protein